jgi:hypothetical protein
VADSQGTISDGEGLEERRAFTVDSRGHFVNRSGTIVSKKSSLKKRLKSIGKTRHSDMRRRAVDNCDPQFRQSISPSAKT